MKKIVSIIALVLSASLLFIGCASAPKDNPYSEENIRKYPLEDYSEVIESKLSQQELFLHTREWIIQNSQILHESNPLIRHYYNPKEFPTLPTNSDIISIIVVTIPDFGKYSSRELTFNLVIEFKNNKMKVSMLNIGADLYGGAEVYYGRMNNTSGEVFVGDIENREFFSKTYIAKRDEILSAMRQIAAGTMPGVDW